MDLLKKNAHSIYYFGLILMAVALPLSKFLNGLSMFIILGAWVVGGDYKEKFRLFFSSKIALLWCSVYLLHLIGLLYTSDYHYASDDLRIKLPLLIFPLIMSSSKPPQSSHAHKSRGNYCCNKNLQQNKKLVLT